MPPITERSAAALAAAIRSGELTSAEVVEAHLERLAEWNPAINAVVVELADEARAAAAAADERVRGGGDLPPLLGVPCTIKESFAYAGHPHTGGVVARAEHRAEATAPAAQRLLDAGAIPLGLTNVSELTLWVESENRLYGRTRNPYDPRRTAGGSSGGEGAAMGAGIAPFGVGSDVGGSIRIPAYCGGVFGHKPSPGLVPLDGTWPESAGEVERLLAAGPLARRAEDLMPVLRILSGPDGETLGDPARVDLRGLRVRISDDAFLGRIHEDVLMARERAAGALAAAGATLERVSMRELRRALLPYLAALADNPATVRDILLEAGAEPLGLRSLVRRNGPHTLATRITLAGETLNKRFPEPLRRRLLETGRAFARELEETIGDGVLLHPPMPGVAPRHGGTVGRLWWIQPMAVFNLGSVPVTQVPLGLDRRGLPLGVQVAAAPGRDHVAIAVALELERVFGGWTPPRPPAARP